jgi:hypothetical protein
MVALRGLRYLKETKVMNSESQILDGWNNFKQMFCTKSEKLSKFSPTIKLECEEPDERTFYVNHKGRRALEFTLDLGESRITCEDRWNGRPKSSINIVICGPNVIFANGQSGIILPEFMDKLLRQITRSRAA